MMHRLSPGYSLNQGRYRILRYITAGGQSAVYEAWANNFESHVIVKQAFVNEDWAHNAFRKEAKLLVTLHHQCLPKVFDFFTEGGSAYLVMSYIEGDDLDVVIKSTKPSNSIAQILTWARQLFDVIDYLHTRTESVIHSDIKPKNIRLNKEGQLFLLDFGMARGFTTGTLLRGGSRYYASPEQLKDEDFDSRSDIYSLAATLYYMFTATDPTDALAREEAILGERGDPLEPPDKLNPHVPSHISTRLMQAMSLNPAERPAFVRILRGQILDENWPPAVEDERTLIRNQEKRRSESGAHRRANVIAVDLGHGETVKRVEKENEFLNFLMNKKEIAAGLLSVILDLIETEKPLRRERLKRYASLLDSPIIKKEKAFLGFIKQLIEGPDIAPEALLRIKSHLANRKIDPAPAPRGRSNKPTHKLPVADGGLVVEERGGEIHSRLAQILQQKPIRRSPLWHSLTRPGDTLEHIYMWLTRGCLAGVGLLALSLLVLKSQLLALMSVHTGLIHVTSVVCLICIVLIIRHGGRRGSQQSKGAILLLVSFLSSSIFTFIIALDIASLFL